MIVATASLLLAALGACTPEMRQMSSGILSSTGLVSSSQAEAMIDAGGKLSKAAQGLTDEQEYYLGRSVSAMVLDRYPRLPASGFTPYLNKVGIGLARHSDKPETFAGYHFAVLDSDQINAVSAPGGFVFVSRGFIKRLPDEDTLAAVLAHEIGHIVKGHGVSAISSSNVTEALLLVGKEVAASQGSAPVQQLTGLFGDSVNQVFEALITNGYSRSQEYEADAYAAELLRRTGYNPQALVQVLDILATEEGNASGGWMETHPKAAKRKGQVEDELSVPANAEAKRAARRARFTGASASLTGTKTSARAGDGSGNAKS